MLKFCLCVRSVLIWHLWLLQLLCTFLSTVEVELVLPLKAEPVAALSQCMHNVDVEEQEKAAQ